MNTKEKDIKSESGTGPGTRQRGNKWQKKYQEFWAGGRDYEISEKQI